MQATLLICGAKPRKVSEIESNSNEVLLENSGSPLPLPFDSLPSINSTENFSSSMKHLAQNHVLYPLSPNVGRKLLLMCNSVESDILKKLPILVVCHGKNSKPSNFFGSYRHVKNSRFHIINQGLVTKQEQLPRLSILKENHLKGFPRSFYNIETSVFARYDFLEHENKENSTLKPVKDANLFMECSWSNSLSVLEPLTDDCFCVAKIKTVGGCFESGAFSMYKEIKLIEALQEGLQTGIMTWLNTETDRNIFQEVKELINCEKSNPSKNVKCPAVLTEQEMHDQDSPLEKAVMKIRPNLDFTEKLWVILKDCSSTEELIEILTFVYNSFDDFIARPFVFKENKSTIAVDVKNMKEKLILCPVLEPKTALKLLLEIGIEKMRRDYATLFLSLELIPHECLSYYHQFDLLSLESITCLRKMHCVLELAIVCVKYLSLPSGLLSTFVRNTLKHYTAVPDIDFDHVFSFQIPTIEARQLLNLMRPTVWEISLTSSIKGFMKQSIHRYQTIPVHEHIYAPENYNPKLMLKTASYTYLTVTFLQDDLLVDEE
ncbi:protein zwilch homolog [Trichonephila clavata]|uniref:Protein zwilch n=1 Tax=Trichonephila clavata TaxID=2740835 RepID=A0A8X6HIM0_TRICU|nr:protein zwilch homolog [Trichonephila clavata]